jgi:RNA-binding protein YlmH
MTKEEQLLCKRLQELAFNTFRKGINTYTEFLNMNEINLYYTIKNDIPSVSVKLFGGYEEAERKMLCFFDNALELEPDFPIDCIHIEPLNAKFSDALTHRDYLGALLNLGIERYTIGDILITNNEGNVYCNSKMGDYILQNLTKIRHTNVKCSRINLDEVNYTPKFQEIRGTVASVRLDTILTLAFQGSRSSLANLIAAGKVYVNSRLIESNSYALKEGDIVSVRGYGKFIYKEQQNQTRKGRYFVVLLKYI